jgi:RTA1 like protein
MDCISIVAQSIGAAMLFNDSLSLDELKRARLILEAGLFVQVIGFSIFLFIAVWFDIKTTRHLGERIAHLRWFMNAFYISGGLIMIRSIYRLAGTYDCSLYNDFPHRITAEFITIDFNARPPSGYLYGEFIHPMS